MRCFLFITTFALIALIANDPSFAANLNLDFNDSTPITARLVQVIGLITILSLAPSILVTMTSFTRIIVVLSFLRSALGLQQTPPNTVIVSLALFLTFFIMEPSLKESYDKGIKPMIENHLEEKEAFKAIAAPFHDFMLKNVIDKDLLFFIETANIDKNIDNKDIPFKALIPAFIISELQRAFEIGFLIFIPFLIIDMIVSAFLMSMGMMMLPPVLISLPFKIIFFVLIDGWNLISGSLVNSFN